MANSPNNTHQIFSSRVKISAYQYIGDSGRIFWHEDTGELRLSDGHTPHGLPIFLGGGSGFGYNTRLVDTPTYIATSNDYYIGVNYAGPVTITLPNTTDGDKLIIKDESGNCASNPITFVGTVDNDPGGVILASNNGAVHMIYRDGWRII